MFTFTLPTAGSSEKSAAQGKVSGFTESKILPYGESFFGFARREANQLTIDEDREKMDAYASTSRAGLDDGDDANDTLGMEQEDRALLLSDPKEWKSLDHYAVLGLSELRYKATDDQIKRAHHRKVIRHHPDKKAMAQGGANTNDDSFFKCIAKSMEVLSNPEKRRQFDSVDSGVPDTVPEGTTDENFYELWTPVFEREGRFSKRQPVPTLGDKDASKKEVEDFYSFWYNFDSWRSFEYLDKDAPEGADSRAEKRYQENKNKSERAKHKKDDIVRLRDLVDLAISLDPRMKAFKAAEKAAREARKKASGVMSVEEKRKKQQEEEAARKEAEAKAAEEQAKKDADAKATREAAKKAREAVKKAMKRDKKAIATLATNSNYFAPEGSLPEPSVVAGVLGDIDTLWESIETPEESTAIKTDIESKGDASAAKDAIISWISKKGLTDKVEYLK